MVGIKGLASTTKKQRNDDDVIVINCSAIVDSSDRKQRGNSPTVVPLCQRDRLSPPFPYFSYSALPIGRDPMTRHGIRPALSRGMQLNQAESRKMLQNEDRGGNSH
jgi:hypothetical protein